MNQKLVESLAQIILSLSDEERKLLESKIREPETSQQMADLEDCLKRFEEKYQISSKDFYRQFQAGDLGDSADFFEWNTYCEMLNDAQVSAF